MVSMLFGTLILGGGQFDSQLRTLRVKLRRTECEHMFFALPSNSDMARRSRHVANVQDLEVADLQPTSRGTTSSMAQGKAQSPQRRSGPAKGHERVEEPAPTHQLRLVFKIFDMRRGFIGMQSMSFWSRRNSRTAKAAVLNTQTGNRMRPRRRCAPRRRVMLLGQ